MRPVSQNITATGVGAPVVLDYMRDPFSVTVALNFTTGSGNATVGVQYSMDDPYAVYATDYGTNANWVLLSSMTTKVADADGSFSAPVRAVRYTCTIFGGGTVRFGVIQAGAAA